MATNQLRIRLYKLSTSIFNNPLPVISTFHSHQQTRYKSSSSGQESNFKGLLPGLSGLGLLGGSLVLYNYLERNKFAEEPKRSYPIGLNSTKTANDLNKVQTSQEEREGASKESATNSLTDPATSAPIYVNNNKPEFPSHVPYLIIGAGTAGVSAAKAIRASDSMAKVLMVGGDLETGEGPSVWVHTHNSGSNKQFKQPPPYLRPPLSKELWRRKETRRQEMLDPNGDMRKHSWLYFEPESYFVEAENLGMLNYGAVALHRGDPVVKLNPESRKATLKSGLEISYDYCLIATGSRPRHLPSADKCVKTNQDLVKEGRVSYFRSIYDFNKLERIAAKYCDNGGKILIVGGGFLGCELASSIRAYADRHKAASIEVSHMYRESVPMGHVLPPNLAAFVGRFEESRGVSLTASSDLVSVELLQDQSGSDSSSDARIRVRFRKSHPSGKTTLEETIVDHIVCAVGVDPCVDLAESAGLEIDAAHGGYLVNAEMESRAGIYVAGDAASYWDPVLGCRRRVEHLNFAEETGVLAGRNMAAAKMTKDPNSTQDDDSQNLRYSTKYQFQSSLWSNLGRNIAWDAVGHVDSRNLETYAYFANPVKEQSDASSKESNSSLRIQSSEDSNLGPGVVFYLTPREKRLVGILLWNLPDEIYEEDKHMPPSRLNLARSLLAKKLMVDRKNIERDLQTMARDFDIYGQINTDYQELKQLLSESQSVDEPQPHGSDTPQLSDNIPKSPNPSL